MLAALWVRVQGWLAMTGSVLLVLLGAYAAGGRAAKRSAELDRAKSDAKIRRKADDVDREVSALDDDAVRHRAGDWVRNKDRR